PRTQYWIPNVRSTPSGSLPTLFAPSTKTEWRWKSIPSILDLLNFGLLTNTDILSRIAPQAPTVYPDLHATVQVCHSRFPRLTGISALWFERAPADLRR